MADKILIVEDERITAEDLSDTLTSLGYHVTAVVSTGKAAILEAEKNPPDLAVMDIRIHGDMDGTETARILQERFDIPAVYLTAHADRDTINRAKQAKPLGYVIKPFQTQEMQAAVEIALHRHRQDRKSRARHRQATDVLKNILLGIISVDNAEVVLIFNPAAEELTGWTQQDAVGGSVRSVFRLADLRSGAHSDLPLDDVLNRGSLTEIRSKSLVTKDGMLRPIVGNMCPVPASNGGVGGAVIVFESAESEAADPFLSSRFQAQHRTATLQFGRFQVIAVSDQMKKVLAFGLRVARSEASTILLEGASGTGKDLLAQFLHYSSDRFAGPFIAVNCAAIPENLIESEIFGHESGAFTAAHSEKKGLFELANGGTLLLDEISELTPSAQTKLLRILEERTFRRVGGQNTIEVDVRVIAATNRKLAERVQQGSFRVDLFHRLSVIPITIPLLRERPDDILPLANHFLRESAQRHKSQVRGFASACTPLLLKHAWPGNVRELRNVIENAVVLEDREQIQPERIKFVSVSPALTQNRLNLSLRDSERELVMRALQDAGGNQSEAARLLGITRDMLRYRVKKLGLKRRSKLSRKSSA
jgi:PAS domain S-box-containing protein